MSLRNRKFHVYIWKKLLYKFTTFVGTRLVLRCTLPLDTIYETLQAAGTAVR